MKPQHVLTAPAPVVRRQLLVSLLAVLLPVAAVAAGETVPCPQKKAGQWYRFSKTDLYDKTTEQLTKIDSVEGDRLFITESGEALITDKMHNWHKLGERTATPKYYNLPECPFSLGETRIYKDVNYDGVSVGAKARGTITVTVSPEFALLTVKAGSFRVVKIISDNSYHGDTRLYPWAGTAQLVSYYAPELGIAVKTDWMLHTMPAPSTLLRDRLELLDYSLGD